MKRIFIILSVVASILLAFSCQKGDGDVDYGNNYIYMPQSKVTGGLNNHYQVPSSTLENTRNFVLTDDSVDIILGVLRSGKQSGSAFTVDIVVNNDASARAAAAIGAEVLAEDAYSLPAKAEVEAGSNAATFYLSVSKSQLAANAGKTLVLEVGIANPSAYELASTGTSTCVVINVDSLLQLI